MRWQIFHGIVNVLVQYLVIAILGDQNGQRQLFQLAVVIAGSCENIAQVLREELIRSQTSAASVDALAPGSTALGGTASMPGTIFPVSCLSRFGRWCHSDFPRRATRSSSSRMHALAGHILGVPLHLNVSSAAPTVCRSRLAPAVLHALVSIMVG